MQGLLSAFAVLPFLALSPLHAQQPLPAPKAAAKAQVPVYDEKAIGKDQIAAALAHAKRDNTRVLVQWGANWCTFCTALARLESSDKDIAKELLYEYEVVKLDIGTWDKIKCKDLIQKYGLVNLGNDGVPYLTVLDSDGKVIANQATGPLENGDAKTPSHDPKKVLDFLKSHEAPRVDAQTLYDAALARAAQEGKLVFLHFGAPWCGWCHKLEDWMARPAVSAVLAKEFVDVKIDVDRNAGAKDMRARMDGLHAGGIPFFAFLGPDGKVLADSNGAKGTIGFPASDEEIAHFRAMLEKACTKITKDEIAGLCDSLVPPKLPPEGQPPGDKPVDSNGEHAH